MISLAHYNAPPLSQAKYDLLDHQHRCSSLALTRARSQGHALPTHSCDTWAILQISLKA